MPDCRVTWIFEQEGRGWTETMYKVVGDTDLSRVMSEAEDIAKLRRQILGKEARIKGMRVAFVTAPFGSIIRPVDLKGDQGQECDVVNTALVVTLYNVLSTKKKPIYARGIWDSVVIDGGKISLAPVGFVQKYNAWTKALISNSYGWQSVTAKPNSLIKTYTVGAGNVVSFEVQTPLFDVGLAGKRVSVRLSGINGKSTLNGAQIVEVVDATHAKIVKPIACGPYVSGGKCVLNQKGIVTAASQIPTRIGTRRAGAPLLYSPGHAKARPRT